MLKEYLMAIESVIQQGPYADTWMSLSNHSIPSWYQDAKFGIFIHWGVYSVPAYSYEWYPRHMYIEGTKENEHHIKTYGSLGQFGYADFIPRFTADHFDADEWLSLFEKAGAKYIVPVAEHHDGFQMYGSKLSKWNAVNMGPRRDILRELGIAAESRNIQMCVSNHRAEHYWYFNGGRTSPSDIDNPDRTDFYGPAVLDPTFSDPFPQQTHDIYSEPPTNEFMEDWLVRTCEMIDHSKPGLVYFDWWIQNVAFKPYLRKFAAYYYNRAKEWGKEVTINYKYYAFAYGSAVFDIERGQTSNICPRLWQTDTAIAKNSWGYTDNNDYKSANEIICDLVDVVSKNGCMLLNVGPKADGTITKEEREILLEIGQWLSVNGEGIYGSTYWQVYGEGPTQIPDGHFSDTARKPYTGEDIRYTYKDGFVYAYIMAVPCDGVVRMTALRNPKSMEDDINITDVCQLGIDRSFTFSRNAEALILQVEENTTTVYPLCYRITID